MIEGKIRMFDWEKSSGVEAPRKKNTFLAPHPLQGFSKWTRMRSWAHSNNKSKSNKTKHY